MAISSIAYLAYSSRGVRPADPYDNLHLVGVGANAGMMLVTGTIVGAGALVLLLLALALEKPLRTRASLVWIAISLAPIAVLAVCLL